MIIKELDDMLALVKEMPRGWQMKCAQAMWSTVEAWEERQQEPNLSDADWEQLKLQRAETRRLLERISEMKECGRTVEIRSGLVESFARDKGHGYIRMEDGERALLSRMCLRAAGYRDAKEGSCVEFIASCGSRGWEACRILSLSVPQ
jgi:cold shock CspA family protein